MSAIQPANTVVDCLLWLSRELSKIIKSLVFLELDPYKRLMSASATLNFTILFIYLSLVGLTKRSTKVYEQTAEVFVSSSWYFVHKIYLTNYFADTFSDKSTRTLSLSRCPKHSKFNGNLCVRLLVNTKSSPSEIPMPVIAYEINFIDRNEPFTPVVVQL